VVILKIIIVINYHTIHYKEKKKRKGEKSSFEFFIFIFVHGAQPK